MRRIAALAVLAAAALVPRAAHAQTTVVTCESYQNQRQICSAGNVAGVSVRQQLSGTPCIQGRTWGATRNAVWVSGGCRAEFNVTQYSTGYGSGRYGNGTYGNGTYGNGRYDDRYGNGYGSGNSAVNLCRRAVRSQLGRVSVDASMANASRNNPRVRWRASTGQTGTCRIDRDGNVSLRYDR